MKFSTIIFASGFFIADVAAFQITRPSSTKAQTGARLGPLSVATLQGATVVDIHESAQRDVYSMQDWAQNCGAQLMEGVELTSGDGYDYSVMTNQDMPEGTNFLVVPSEMILSSDDIADELGGHLEASETALIQYFGSTQRLPLFRLVAKILVEYEAGENSPYYPWLNSLPRLFYNGVAMTDACFACLPPYAAALSTQERNDFSKFLNAFRKGYLPVSQEILEDDNLVKWAYNVALTRHKEVWNPKRQKKIAPMADMFNHATNPNVSIEFDDEGNCYATTTDNVPAGSPLTISLGNPTNPTPLFAKYGFLYDDCSSLFCKAMQLESEIDELGYEFKDLLFYVDTGDIDPKVWDIFLYNVLQFDQDIAGGFYVACKTKDEATKEGYHQEYFQYTLEALKTHVDTILHDVDNLTMMANSYDLATHPRVPMIVAHNDLVKRAFMSVKSQLDAMG